MLTAMFGGDHSYEGMPILTRGYPFYCVISHPGSLSTGISGTWVPRILKYQAPGYLKEGLPNIM